MKTLFVFAFCLFLARPLSARIGETETQITDLYGAPVTRIAGAIPALTYSVDGWIVTCEFVRGVCARVSYLKPGEWTEETFEKLLAANGASARWNDCGRPSLKKLTRSWKRDDGTTATWTVGCLSVTSLAYEKAKMVGEVEALMAATNT